MQNSQRHCMGLSMRPCYSGRICQQSCRAGDMSGTHMTGASSTKWLTGSNAQSCDMSMTSRFPMPIPTSLMMCWTGSMQNMEGRHQSRLPEAGFMITLECHWISANMGRLRYQWSTTSKRCWQSCPPIWMGRHPHPLQTTSL